MTLTGNIITTYWIVFLVVWAIGVFFQKRSQEKPILSNIFHFLLIFVSLSILFASQGIPFLNKIIIRVSLAVNILSVMFSTLGLIVSVYSRIVLGSNWSGSAVIKKEHELVTKGPYKYVRHPIYFGIVLLYIGTAIATGNLGGIIGFMILIVEFSLKIKEEEKMMKRQFGKRYLYYMKSTKALIPWII